MARSQLDADDILNNPDVDIVVEVIGGEQPALDYILKSISLGKHVVTANKEVMAKHGAKILTHARKHGVQVLFEASVAGGTPIIAPLLRDLVANEVVSINGIINGTTNYILTKMAQEGQDFGVALAAAQELGYAESDPTNDVEGIDAAYKLAILSTLAFRARVSDADVYSEGITHLTAQDFRYASELGYAIKLLAIASKTNGSVHVRVHPAMVRSDVMLAKVDGVLNAIEVQTDLAGRVLFHGRGAGDMPTTSAVLADVMDIARNIVSGIEAPPLPSLTADVHISPISELETKYYMRNECSGAPRRLRADTQGARRPRHQHRIRHPERDRRRRPPRRDSPHDAPSERGFRAVRAQSHRQAASRQRNRQPHPRRRVGLDT